MGMFGNIILVVFVVVTSASYVSGGSCPDGWTKHEEMCYLFKKETYNWFDARAVCSTLLGFLAEAKTQEVNQFLHGFARSHSATTNTWIGLQDFTEENMFVWVHSRTKANPTFWWPGEPNDANGEEDCVALLQSPAWMDANCEDHHNHFICQQQAVDGALVG